MKLQLSFASRHLLVAAGLLVIVPLIVCWQRLEYLPAWTSLTLGGAYAISLVLMCCNERDMAWGFNPVLVSGAALAITVFSFVWLAVERVDGGPAVFRALTISQRGLDDVRGHVAARRAAVVAADRLVGVIRDGAYAVDLTQGSGGLTITRYKSSRLTGVDVRAEVRARSEETIARVPAALVHAFESRLAVLGYKLADEPAVPGFRGVARIN